MPIARASLSQTVDAVNAAHFDGRKLTATERTRVARWIAARQGLPGSYGGSFAGFPSERSNGIVLFTGERITSASAAMISHHMLGIALMKAGRRTDGAQRLRQAIAEGESMTKAQPGDGWSLSQLAAARIDLGWSLLKGRDWDAEGCGQLGEGLHLLDTLAAHGEVPGEVASYRDEIERRWATCQHHRSS